MNSRRWYPALAALLAVSACGTWNPDARKPKVPAVEFTANVKPDAEGVKVDTIVKISADHGDVLRAALSSSAGAITFDRVGDQWVAQRRLEPGVKYTLTASGRSDNHKHGTYKENFTTEALPLRRQTFPYVYPQTDKEVGVGMPVVVRFDVPVKNRKLFEQNMIVQTSKPVEGRWAWFSNQSVHFRPKDYWPADTDVTVKVNVNSLPAGNGIYGQKDQKISFHVGQKVIGYVDVNRFTLTVKENDKVVKTIPVSTGDSEHRTRQGTKVVMEQLRKVDMDAATTGIDSEDDGYYNLKDVEYAQRLTNSGEFLHAAPWSVGSQGRANVSHGCTGMSTTNAAWLFTELKVGDPVEYTGSSRPIEPGNGWTDWNVSWDEWVAKSALPEVLPTASPSPSTSSSSGAKEPFKPTDQSTPNGIRIKAPPYKG